MALDNDWSKYDDKIADESGSSNRKPIPVGTELRIKIEGAEERKTSKGGTMIKLTLAVVAGEHKKRKVWHSLHVACGNEAVSHAARRELQVIAKRIGLDGVKPGNLRDLIGGGLVMTVSEHEEGNDGKIYERVNNPQRDPNAEAVSPRGSDFDDEDIPF